jgi:hypothetical protein
MKDEDGRFVHVHRQEEEEEEEGQAGSYQKRD